MIDQHLEALVSKSLDEPLTPQEQAQLDRALAESAELRALAEDLKQIKSLAASPRPPAPKLSAAFTQKVVPQEKRPISPLWAGGLLAAAAAMVLFFGPNLPEDQPTVNDLSYAKARQASANLRQDFYVRISQMEHLAVAHLLQLPPEFAGEMGQQLAFINDTIALCEYAVERTQGSKDAHKGLAEAYGAKATLLDTILST